MRNTINLFAFIIITTTLLTSCASILSGTKQKMHVSTNPPGARVFVDGKDMQIITPAEVKIPRKKSVTVSLQKNGYEDGQVKKEGSFNPTVIANIAFGAIPGALVDLGTGAWYKYSDSNIFYDFTQGNAKKVPIEDPTIRAGEAKNMVTRDNPGGTALERTIIRWNFDSDPRGGRIFWRVISSIPDHVKNTNETYLTNTPYEETRSFNILGLTYENSRDVTIEIKVTKKGYMDQVKRYNVRQAIDQQEISGFFELVENR
ncbi:PEGA domain-containing protein [Dysgonomonas sp. 520]|uniref:PEGA domain-containing protein n=1 Tax=Dysgonomonas sp. 520 TaxID=2302931 RepID=UPI0013D0159B|nr:PEGA domain-containing protein [Dysgonomonas sp. 520]NDW10095.1 PEGA domain-containing protein [Dysgonomonas sp. 520]